MSYCIFMKDCDISKNRRNLCNFEYVFFEKMVVCKKIKSVIERLVRRKTKEFSNGANCQAGFDPSGSQRDAAGMPSNMSGTHL